MLTVLLRMIGDGAVVGLVLFVAAGTVHWWRGWVLLGVLVVFRLVTVVAVYQANPDLLRERAKLPIHRDQPIVDKLLLLCVMITGFLGVPAMAGYDRFRWHVLLPPGTLIAALGLVLFVLGWGIKALALRDNRFATTVLRLQRDRQHVVIESGVYGIVRHPFYAGTPLVLVGMALWLESYTAALLAFVPITFMLARLRLEERFLLRQLPSYAEYLRRVRYRLLPGVW